MNTELEAVAKRLCERGFLAEVVGTPEEAKQKILEYIGDRSVGIAGSATVRDLGLYDALTERGNTVYWHWKVEKPQVEQTRINAIGADVYLCSTNAVTEDGRLVNIDGTGNRLAGMIYGPKTVILAVGKNKLVKDYEEAIARIKPADRTRAVRASKRPARSTTSAATAARRYACATSPRSPSIRRGAIRRFASF